ncbi:NAD-dependent epimerase/dehydratase family protein [Pedobacter cryoconitis]|uniref:Nucleoside-diphosphate-sugar epimerase n=1 Tax=Pedobacter cryoconitis TaxID=188932 RepID=A0A327T031_9SPHI|nr:NAD-dependent epimerase/dehydratase family protein [Pedobacter cryoconitis]RAJ33454.1 nucleoside-diphosphate-sugar epimerase [Pedobacter cryoconitis]
MIAENILITGGSGFVGQNLITYLKKHDILNLTITNRDELNKIIDNRLEDINTVIHLAGKAHDLIKNSNPEEYYRINFELTKSLYDVFLASESSKFIFISSVKAATDEVDGVLDESSLPDPKTDYGKSKLMAEEYIQNQVLPAGKSYFIMRPCMIHGPGNKGNLNLLYRVVEKNIPYPLGGFINKRSFLSVENLCFVIKELISRNDIPSGVYHIADDEAISTNELVDIISYSMNKTAKIWKISPPLIRFLARVGTVLHLPLTTERLNKLTESYMVSNEKLIKVLNKSMPLSVREGLKQTVLHFKDPNKYL